MSLIRTFIARAEEYADLYSDDPDTQVGCVLTRRHGSAVIMSSANCLPEGTNRLPRSRRERPLKYDYLVHAEQAAIQACARAGISTHGCRMYLTLFPCHICAQSIINAGISKLICPKPEEGREKSSRHKVSLELLGESDVEVTYYDTK